MWSDYEDYMYSEPGIDMLGGKLRRSYQSTAEGHPGLLSNPNPSPLNHLRLYGLRLRLRKLCPSLPDHSPPGRTLPRRITWWASRLLLPHGLLICR
jgi:hypothetical protein